MPASPSAASPVTDHHPQAEPHTPPRARSPSPFVAPDYSTSLQPHSSFRLSPEHILKTSSNLSLSNHGTFSHSPPQDFNDSVDLDQSIVFPSNFLSPEEFLSVGQEIVQSYKHHLAFLTKKYDLQRMIIDELDASSGRKDGELATLRSKLGRLESRLMEPSTPSASQTLDLETRLEMERAELEAVHEELKDEKARREALEKRVEEIEGVQGRLGVADETGPGKPDGVLGGLAEDVLERDLAGRLFGEKKPILEDIPTGVSNESISTGPSKQSTSSDHTALQPLVVALASARRTIISLTSDLQTTSRQAQANQHALQLTQSELDNQWKRADQHHDDIQRLQTHREQLLESLRRSDAEVVGLEKTVDEIKGERDELAVELEEMKDQVGIILREKEQTLRESGAEALDKANEEKEELEREVGTLRSAVEALTKERLDLVEELEQIQGVGLEKDVEIDSLKKVGFAFLGPAVRLPRMLNPPFWFFICRERMSCLNPFRPPFKRTQSLPPITRSRRRSSTDSARRTPSCATPRTITLVNLGSVNPKSISTKKPPDRFRLSSPARTMRCLTCSVSWKRLKRLVLELSRTRTRRVKQLERTGIERFGG